MKKKDWTDLPHDEFARDWMTNVLANENLPEGYTPEYTPKDIQLMHSHYAMDAVKALKKYVDDILYRETYHDDKITREKVEKISARLKDVINYLT